MEKTPSIISQMKPSENKVIIYLAGKIPKGGEAPDPTQHWTQDHMDRIRASLSDSEVVLLNPAFKDGDLSDQESVFGRDIYYVSSSSVIFVDARGARGLGVGAEMMWAKVNGIPVISWAPENSHYNKKSTIVFDKEIPGFIHPFIHALSDKIVENIDEGCEWIKNLITEPETIVIKDSKDIRSTMNRYKESLVQEELSR